jgi:hypothetical protein
MNVYDLVKRRALVSRGTARAIADTLRTDVGVSDPTLELDFSGIEAVTPSFVDELIGALSASDFPQYERIRVTHPPSRLSEKFRAIGRGRGVSIEETSAQGWLITFSPSPQDV